MLGQQSLCPLNLLKRKQLLSHLQRQHSLLTTADTAIEFETARSLTFLYYTVSSVTNNSSMIFLETCQVTVVPAGRPEIQVQNRQVRIPGKADFGAWTYPLGA